MTRREASQANSGGHVGFATAEEVADAVLYEGYALYPYRANSVKNQMRFQWGVLVPPEYAEQDPSERTRNRTQCLIVNVHDGRLVIRVRFLHLEERTAEVESQHGSWEQVDYLELERGAISHWDEAVDAHVDLDLSFKDLLADPVVHPFTVEGSETVSDLGDTPDGPARVVRRRRALSGRVHVRAEPMDEQTSRVTVEVSNDTSGRHLRVREEALRRSLVACHTMLAADTARFLSLLSPPAWAETHVDRCDNQGVYPVLIGPEEGEHRLVLASPIILYDHPEVAPESPGDLFDATEIDEILTLRTLTLTDDEKRQARSTDPRTAALMDRIDHLPPEILERLHGTLRQQHPTPFRRRGVADGQEPG